MIDPMQDYERKSSPKFCADDFVSKWRTVQCDDLGLLVPLKVVYVKTHTNTHAITQLFQGRERERCRSWGREVEEGWLTGGSEGGGGGGVLPCSKVKLVMSAMTHSSQHALLTSRILCSSHLSVTPSSPVWGILPFFTASLLLIRVTSFFALV